MTRHAIDQPLKGWRYLKLAFKGFCMGTADVIPGVSGGTIAFICGIYEDFIGAIRSFDIQFVKRLAQGKIQEALDGVAWRFLGTLLSGIGAAILLFSQVITYLLMQHPILINAFFFGLILATIPIIGRVIRQWTWGKISTVLLAAGVTYAVVNMSPTVTPETSWFLFLCGMIAISAMILPGISGAFILLLFGKYEYILQAIHQRDMVTLLIFGMGVMIGIMSFARVLNWLFHRWHDTTIAVLLGIVTGSLSKIWPWKETVAYMTSSHGKVIPTEQINFWPSWEGEAVVWATGLMVIGFVTAFFLQQGPKGAVMGKNI